MDMIDTGILITALIGMVTTFVSYRNCYIGGNSGDSGTKFDWEYW